MASFKLRRDHSLQARGEAFGSLPVPGFAPSVLRDGMVRLGRNIVSFESLRNHGMRVVKRHLGLAVASLGLLGALGCSDSNEKEVQGAGQGVVDPGTPKGSDYGKLAPKANAQEKNPYGGRSGSGR